MATLYSYSRWDGSQSPFALDEEAILGEFSDQLMAKGDVSAALHTMVQRGLRTRSGERVRGLQDLLQRLRNHRQEVLASHDLGSVLDDLRRQLAAVRERERQGIQDRLREARQKAQEAQANPSGPLTPELARELLARLEQRARRSQELLDALPQDLGDAIRALNSYDFMDPEARRLFEELKRALQRQMVDRPFHSLTERLQGMDARAVEGMKQLLRDLNRLLEQRLRGEEPDFQAFLDRYGSSWGEERPESLDQLLDQLQRHAAQTESLLDSLSPEMRQELENIVQGLFQDDDLHRLMAELRANLEALSPTGRLGRAYPFHGDEPVTLSEALSLLDEVRRLDNLEQQIREAQQSGSLAGVDQEALSDLLGQEAAQTVAQLQSLAETLERAGYIQRVGDRFELTPRGMRRIGQKALGEIFSYIKKDRAGRHAARDHGPGGDLTDSVVPYSFGAPFLVDLQKTLSNAVLRAGPGLPVHLEPQDFEVHRTEELTIASTVLMVDLSLSMAMRGNFLAAKKVALALDSLIRTQFYRDNLHIVGFSTYAREVKPERLASLSWDELDPYTNIQHGLVISQRLLARRKGGTKQIIIISDGEPTAHMEGGQLFLQYPPSPRTIRETLKEVKRATQQGIIINTFMLERSAYLVEFVEELARINRGRVFYTTPERLGEYILVDYLTTKRRKTLV